MNEGIERKDKRGKKDEKTGSKERRSGVRKDKKKGTIEKCTMTERGARS